MITFTRTAQTYDAATDTMTSVATTVTGDAVQVTPKDSDLVRFRERDLVITETILLLFTPTTYGQVPAPGDVVTWPNSSVGLEYTVRDVNPLAPDGVVILARVACGR